MGDRFRTKLQQLLRLKELLLAHPEGLRKAEIARRLDVHRATVADYLNDLGEIVPVYEPLPDHFAINRDTYRVEVLLTLDEAVALHLASRLLATRTDKHYPHAAKALRALGSSLEEIAPLVSEHLRRSAGLLDGPQRRQDPIFMHALEQLTRAWSQGRKVRLTHQMEDGNVFSYTFAPYFIEPYAVGRTLHVIGWREPPGALRTFKIERIRTVELIDEPYEIPTDFDASEQLRDAWGIWYSDEAPQEVVLRFSRQVAHRVSETRWHHAEQVRELDDGGLEWRARVAAWQEMLPWVRGWGADVEVVGPEELREEMKRHAVRLVGLYDGESPPKTPLHLLPYAKTEKGTENVHQLLYHLIDVGQVATVLWQEALSDGTRLALARMLALDVEACGRFLAFLAALHDLGKAGPAYQNKYAPRWLTEELTQSGLVLRHATAYSARTQQDAPHATVTTWALETLLPELLDLEPRFAKKLATALGGHHGTWPAAGATTNIDDSTFPRWDELRRDLFWHLRAVFNPPHAVEGPSDRLETNTFLTLFSGFVSVADWLGSRNEECFGFVQDVIPTRQYAARAAEKARQSLLELGWLGWQPEGRTVSFGEAFAYLNFDSPRGVQREAIDAARDVEQPALLILEAPTGIGKTETALYLADYWLQQSRGRGLYVAMPTQATSNQMYRRTRAFLGQRYAGQALNYHLIHGQAAWQDALEMPIKLQDVGDDEETTVAAEAWFTPRKRTLLAPFGVGTVDQALMSILQTRHFFVRLFGLSHKVLVFDEVHAYDVYMNTLFQRLLQWLSAAGTSVIILSATLPAATRRMLLEAYSGHASEAREEHTSYPLLTVGGPRMATHFIPLSPPNSYTLQLAWTAAGQPDALVALLKQLLAGDGCAVVICNTVRRAQEIYDAAIQSDLRLEEGNLILFHARFPPIRRQEIERRVLDKFGKDGVRPPRALLIATQVVEQSLDLDFDVMISDVAPIDLLIQRAGRLQRHPRGPRRHPRRLWLVEPAKKDDGLPDFGADRFIYEPYVLLRTMLALRHREAITLPEETTALIEAVYRNDDGQKAPDDAWRDALEAALARMENARRETESKAAQFLVYEPRNPRLLFQAVRGLEEDNPDVHHTLRAQTRDIDAGITLICMHRSESGLFVDGDDGPVHVALEGEPTPREVRLLLRNSLTLQHYAVVKHFTAEENQPPAGWRKNAALRHCRPLIFEENQCQLPGHTLRISRDKGLEIIKKEVT